MSNQQRDQRNTAVVMFQLNVYILMNNGTILTSTQHQTLHSSPLIVFTCWRTRDSFFDKYFAAAIHMCCLRRLNDTIDDLPNHKAGDKLMLQFPIKIIIIITLTISNTSYITC